MRWKHLVATIAFLFAATLAFAQAEDVIEGLWICDHSEDGGPLVELTLMEGEFTAEITTPDETMVWTGTYEFAENVVTFTMETGTGDGTYDPENDTISISYEEVLYVFERVDEE
ncbi:MAG TPA: hypothetical protein VMX35_06085 [Acidobacteriota bacterium]|nr:hypothetical protein [Acidobacteriota bacterium]